MSDAIARLNAALEGRYRIERELGEGGMATVYLADDLRHERRVAVKVLKPELAAVLGAERFLAEIKTTANLQHPHILPLFDSGEVEGFLYYVMPYIEGETLQERIDREHQLPVDDALGIATAVANALYVAHGEGIVHRDIKPANILLSRGEPLVSDFGIALAVGAAGGNRLTETGLSVGTPYYMSPEQATGDQVIGPASDTYALGCVLYEMLVGDPPYVGGTAQAVLGKIIQGSLVEPRTIRPSVPANVDAVIRKALEKIPADRFTDAHDFARALADPSFRYGDASVDTTGKGAGVWRRAGPASAALAAILALVAAWGWLRSPPPGPVTRFSLALPPGQEVIDLVLARSFSVAPGGRAIVYVGPGEDGARQLWVKQRSELDARPLPDTEGAQSPAISPDGTRVVFEQTGRLRLIPLRGGGAVTLADTVLPDIAWSGDDEVLFVSPGGFDIVRVSVGGGAPEVLVDLDGRGAVHPHPLPDGRGLLFLTCSSTSCNDPELWIHDRASGESRTLVPGAMEGWFVESGHIVFLRSDGAVFALPFDVGALEATGSAFPVLEGAKVDAVFPDLDITTDGTVLMMVGDGGGGGAAQEVVAVSRDGTVRPVDPDWRIQSARIPGWSLSPDGARLAIGLDTDEGADIWVKELPTGPLLRLTYDPAEDHVPFWSPDGDSIYFLSRRREGIGDLYVRRSDGADDVRPVLEVDQSLWSLTWTRDRAWLIARAGGLGGQPGQRNIVAYRMDGDAVDADSGRIELLSSEYDAVAPDVSPDGRWLAYASVESGAWEVYVRPFPDVRSGRTAVSRGGGHGPMWSHSGEELFYVSSDGQMMAASVETGASFRVGARTALFELPPGTRDSELQTTYDVTPDDQEFILVRAAGVQVDRRAPLVLIENWLQEIKERGGG